MFAACVVVIGIEGLPDFIRVGAFDHISLRATIDTFMLVDVLTHQRSHNPNICSIRLDDISRPALTLLIEVSNWLIVKVLGIV